MASWHELFRKLPLDRKTAAAVVPLVGRLGTKGMVALARSYLGPIAEEVEQRGRGATGPDKAGAPAPAPAAAPTVGTSGPGTRAPNFGSSGGPGTRGPFFDSGGAGPGTRGPFFDSGGAGPGTRPGGAPAPSEPPPPPPPKPSGLDEGEVAILGMALTKLLYEAGELALHNPTVSAGGKQPEFKLDEQGRPPALSLTHVVAATRLVRAYAAERTAHKQAEEARARPSPRARLQAARGEQYALVTRYAYAPRTPTPRFPR